MVQCYVKGATRDAVLASQQVEGMAEAGGRGLVAEGHHRNEMPHTHHTHLALHPTYHI